MLTCRLQGKYVVFNRMTPWVATAFWTSWVGRISDSTSVLNDEGPWCLKQREYLERQVKVRCLWPRGRLGRRESVVLQAVWISWASASDNTSVDGDVSNDNN